MQIKRHNSKAIRQKLKKLEFANKQNHRKIRKKWFWFWSNLNTGSIIRSLKIECCCRGC